MKKIIEYVIKTEDLDLEGTGVDIMSLVESPAIQADFLAFADDVEDPMIPGIIDILLQIEDLDNRAEVLETIIQDLNTEGIPYDIEDLRTRAGLAELKPYVDETGKVLKKECGCGTYSIDEALYTGDGVLYEGPTHTDADGRPMTGAVHTEDSKYLYHYDELPEEFFDPNPCWSGWEPIGTKIKDGREVPNCVPVQASFASYNDYPLAAKNNAQRALDWVEKNGWGSCGTPVGKARANQLAKGENISVDTIKRMASFARHRQNSDTPYSEGCGGLMWDAWGGSAGVDWAIRKLKQLEREALSVEEQEIIDHLTVRGEEIPADAVFIEAHKSSFSTLGDFLKGITAIDILGRRGVTGNDTEGVEVFRYAGPPAQRGFCQALQRLNKVYRREEITQLNTANPGLGEGGSNSYSVFKYKGGVNCRHYWEKLTMFRDGRETVFVSEGPAEGEAGESNNADRPSPEGAVANNARVNFSIVEDQRIVVGPAMIPNKMIKRIDEQTGAPYHVYFSKKTIRDISEDFLAKANLNNTNIEHTKDTLTQDNTLLESWIVLDSEKDKSNFYGMDMPEGTWMVSYKINDDDTWKRVKEGKLKGFSVEGYFVDRMTVKKD